MHQPNIQMTPARSRPKSNVNVHATWSTVSSSTTSSSPRVIRNADQRRRVSGSCRRGYALVPARNANAGAQKCVTHRVKNTPAVGPPAGTPA